MVVEKHLGLSDDWGYINGDYRAFIKIEIKTALYGK